MNDFKESSVKRENASMTVINATDAEFQMILPQPSYIVFSETG